MLTFVWGPRYETGILRIDTQHRRLVDLINGLGEAIARSETADLGRLYAGVLEYAQCHFADEERLMAEHRLDPGFVARHHELHAQFVRQLDGMHDNGPLTVERAGDLNRFLSSWLTVHILGEDKDIQRNIAAAGGASYGGAPVFEDDTGVSDGEAALLDAVHNLHGILAHANNELRVANAGLEGKVAERTRELQGANAELLAQRDELQRVLRQLGEAQTQLLQGEKLASIGRLAAGVAHEINNPVGFVSSNLTSLGEYVDDLLAIIDAYAQAEPLIARDSHALAAIRRIRQDRDLDFIRDDLKALLAESTDGLRRVAEIVQNLKDFSRVDVHLEVSGRQSTDLHTELDRTINILRGEIRQRAELRREYGELPAFSCHPGQLNQVFLNILVNATQAVEEDGLIIVRTGCADGWIRIEVSDNGCGIPEEQMAHIFEPFHTTKPVGTGTGLGLSVSYSIVHNHGGRIEVSSTVGQGSCFRICLPLQGQEGIR